jgi:hypothetical protein
MYQEFKKNLPIVIFYKVAIQKIYIIITYGFLDPTIFNPAIFFRTKI